MLPEVRSMILLYVNRKEQLHEDGGAQHAVYHFSLSVKDKALGLGILSGLASVPTPSNISGANLK